MAHGITNTDAFGEVRKNGKKAWHGLGIEIPEGLSTVDGFRTIGLDWETSLEPVFCEIAGKRVELPEHRAHVRSDNNELLGLVSDHYQALNNSDLAKFCDQLLGVDSAVSLETAGSLHGGRRIFALLRLPNTFEVAPGDVVKSYICTANGHGGFASFTGALTNIRVVCNNTLTQAEKDLAKGFRFRHMGKIDDKLDAARAILGLVTKQQKQFEEQARALVATDLSVGQVREFMDAAWVASFGKLPDATEQPEAYLKMLEKKNETIAKWLANMENARNSLAGIRGTAWAAFNSVTEWHDHQRGRFQSVAESDARAHSNLFGISNQSKVKVLNAALSLV